MATGWRVLVTGSAGFVGQEMIARLREAGYQTIGLDLERDGLADHYVQHDLRKEFSNPPQFDACIHLASAVGGILFNQHEELLEDNERINETVVAMCARAGCTRLAFMSSINVFESNESFVHSALAAEDQTTPYAISKARGERMFTTRIPNCLVIRPTNVFGKSQRRRHEGVGESHVIPDLLKKIDEEEIVEVLGDGSQVRNFVHVRDLCDFVTRNLSLTGTHYFNIRSDITITIRELVNELLLFKGRSLPTSFQPRFMRYEAFHIRDFDLSLPQSYGWQPSVKSIGEGLSI
ncbi:MAG: NAD-dependent epimerase/dehydratase family protein [Chloroflexota bacterium]